MTLKVHIYISVCYIFGPFACRYVSEKMGGACVKGWLHSFNYELHISNLKHELDSNLIAIGKVKCGIFYHRALLFKVMIQLHR